jgi:hypothetical protein
MQSKTEITTEPPPSSSSGDQATKSATATSWLPPNDLNLQKWAETGRKLGALSRSSNWWIGDWLRYGAAKWGAKYTVAARITGYDVHSLENMVYVASRFPFSLRRENLSWSHHFAVAALGPDERSQWLDLALTHRLSVNDLRIELRAARRQRKEAPAAQKVALKEAIIATISVCPQCGYRLEPEPELIST